MRTTVNLIGKLNFFAKVFRQIAVPKIVLVVEFTMAISLTTFAMKTYSSFFEIKEENWIKCISKDYT